jgi:UDP-2,4-diacetamido-2,4,6-trideoxy-beta-L-altropyranose hydrolase
VILIRADASTPLGTGHAMRCLALTQALRDHGGEVTLATAQLPDGIADRYVAEGASIVKLDVAPASAADLAETTAFAERTGAAWLVLDGYAFDDGYVEAVAAGRRVLLIDDWPRTLATPSLLLNQNLYAAAGDYPNLPPDRLLLGPSYALLRREYAAVPPPVREAGPLERILVTLGGADPDNVTARVVAALARDAQTASTDITVVVGAAHPAAEALRHDIAAVGFQPLRDVRDMLAVEDWADLAIGAAGTTSLELAARGLPMILAVLTDNQVRVAAEMERRGAALSCGAPDAGFETRLLGAIRLLGEWSRRELVSSAGRAIVDGLGAGRVAERLLAAD